MNVRTGHSFASCLPGEIVINGIICLHSSNFTCETFIFFCLPSKFDFVQWGQDGACCSRTSVFVGSVREPDSAFGLMENHWSPDSLIGWVFFTCERMR